MTSTHESKYNNSRTYRQTTGAGFLTYSNSVTGITTLENLYGSYHYGTPYFMCFGITTGTPFHKELSVNYIKESFFDSKIYKESVLDFLNILNNNIG